jgi:acetylornithine/N-succinyldiaminopimelate aminotransferase
LELKQIIDLDQKYFMNTFGSRTPVCFTYGKGINLWDTEGTKYYDFFSGIAVSSLGHAHPNLVNAIKEQAEKLIHCSNLYYIEPQAKLAKVLVENSCADKIFFSNSGAEANEGAIKLARIFFYKKGMPEKYEIITLNNSFHGRTLATVAATAQPKYQKPYYPLTPSFISVPMNDISALENAISDKTCAVMLEPIQGESGVNPLTQDYMKNVRELCNKEGILLIFDEVQTGIGRTGKLFGYQNYGIEPDIFTLAKALGGGVPIGAVCAKEHVAAAFEPGDHGSTFGGNPLACSAGLAVMETIINDNLLQNAENTGNYFREMLLILKNKYSFISEVRGKGLMLGVELTIDKAKDIKESCLTEGYLIGNVGSNVLRILPPLIVTQQDINGFISVLDKLMTSYT